MQYKKNQRMFLFLSIEAVMFLFFLSTEARHVLSMFLIFKKFEPQRSYKHGSYSRKSVYGCPSLQCYSYIMSTGVRENFKLGRTDLKLVRHPA